MTGWRRSLVSASDRVAIWSDVTFAPSRGLNAGVASTGRRRVCASAATPAITINDPTRADNQRIAHQTSDRNSCTRYESRGAYLIAPQRRNPIFRRS